MPKRKRPHQLRLYFRLGWRNIWRNPKRTAIILTAIIIGVWSMLFSSAFLRGSSAQMIRSSIATLTGHVQIHSRGYLQDPNVEHSRLDASFVGALLEKELPSGAKWTDRIKVDAVISNAYYSSRIVLVGIDPDKEALLSFLKPAIVQGEYLKPGNSHEIIIGQAFAEQFKTSLDRKLILMTQDATGELASRAFRICGIYRAELQATENTYVFVHAETLQEMLQMQECTSEISILFENPDQMDDVVAELRRQLPSDEYEVSSWQELLPLVSGTLKMYNQFILLWYLVAFIAMGFGIVNTILMAILERTAEIGLLKTLGMRPMDVIEQILAESLYLLIIGMFIGNILGVLSVGLAAARGINFYALTAGLEYLGASREVHPQLQIGDALLANTIVFCLGAFVSVYPAARAARINPIQALQHS